MRVFKVLSLCLLLSLLLCGCAIDADQINVVSREDGSGTRGAFSELFEITKKNKETGVTTDLTYKKAEVTNSTAVVILTVSEDPNAIGYISMGSLNDSVKALEIDGIAPTNTNVKNGTYPVSRPFLIAVRNLDNPNVSDFVNFILSKDGQAIVAENGYVPSVSEAEQKDYTAASRSGKLTIGGSSSVTPVMEALAEAYESLNPNLTIEIQQSDSTTGITTVTQGISDIGMASRELKDSEKEAGLMDITIAYDGLAVIVNPVNPVNSLTKEQVREIFTGEITSWKTIEEEE